MISIADFETIYAISQHSSLAAVARSLNVSQPAVSQRIAALEQRLHVRLVERSGRAGLVLTNDGIQLAKRACTVLGEVDSALGEIAASRKEIQGHLNVIAPFGFGRAYVASVAASFQEQHQEVSIDLTLSDSMGELPRKTWDIIVHVGPLQESSLVAITMAPNRRFLCASPEYLNRIGDVPQQPRDLANARCLTIQEDSADASLWQFTNRKMPDETTNIRVVPAMSSNDGEVVRRWMISGLGIAQRSEWNVAEDLRTGRLVRLLPDFSLPDAPVVALVSTRDERSSRVQAFIDYLRDSLTPTPWREPV